MSKTENNLKAICILPEIWLFQILTIKTQGQVDSDSKI